MFILHVNMFAGDAAGLALVLITLTASGSGGRRSSDSHLAFGLVGRPFFVVNYDLHRVVGIVALPLALLVSLTGAMLVLYEVGGRLVHALFLTTPAAAAAAQRAPLSHPLAERPAAADPGRPPRLRRDSHRTLVRAACVFRTATRQRYVIELEDSDLPQGVEVSIALMRGNERGDAGLNPQLYERVVR